MNETFSVNFKHCDRFGGFLFQDFVEIKWKSKVLCITWVILQSPIQHKCKAQAWKLQTNPLLGPFVESLSSPKRVKSHRFPCRNRRLLLLVHANSMVRTFKKMNNKWNAKSNIRFELTRQWCWDRRLCISVGDLANTSDELGSNEVSHWRSGIVFHSIRTNPGHRLSIRIGFRCHLESIHTKSATPFHSIPKNTEV